MRLFLLILLLPAAVAAQPSVSKVWVADNRDGTYRNPILHADYSDADVIRVGDDFYLVASSFNAAPGLPILHSRDLVNWAIIGHALSRQPPFDVFSKPQHGNGVWAPAIRCGTAIPCASGQMDWGESWHLRSRQGAALEMGYANYDWFRVE